MAKQFFDKKFYLIFVKPLLFIYMAAINRHGGTTERHDRLTYCLTGNARCAKDIEISLMHCEGGGAMQR